MSSFLDNKNIKGFIYQARNANAWMMSTFILAVLLLFFIVKHFNYISTDKRMLLTYSMATSGEKIEYSSDFSSPTNYLLHIAEADALLYTHWTEKNAHSRRERFIERLERVSRRLNSEQLLNSIEVDIKNHVSQAAVIDGEIQVTKEGKIKIPVRIDRTIAGIPMPPVFMYITFKYAANNEGLPFIVSFLPEEVPRFD